MIYRSIILDMKFIYKSRISIIISLGVWPVECAWIKVCWTRVKISFAEIKGLSSELGLRFVNCARIKVSTVLGLRSDRL